MMWSRIGGMEQERSNRGNQNFAQSKVRTRGHSLKIKGGRFRTELRRNFFSQRVVNLWNSLPTEVVEATSLNMFKARMDGFLIGKGIKGYGNQAGK